MHEHGKKVFIHSCGRLEEVLPDIIECGVDVFNPFQPEVMDVEDVKKRFGGALTFFGGISTRKNLPCATPAQVREETRRLIDKTGRNGGYTAAPANDIPKDALPENVSAMMETLRGQG